VCSGRTSGYSRTNYTLAYTPKHSQSHISRKTEWYKATTPRKHQPVGHKESQLRERVTANCKSHWRTCSLYASSLYLRTRVSGALILFGQTNHATSSNRRHLRIGPSWRSDRFVYTCLRVSIYYKKWSILYRIVISSWCPGPGVERERERQTHTQTQPHMLTHVHTYARTHIPTHLHMLTRTHIHSVFPQREHRLQ